MRRMRTASWEKPQGSTLKGYTWNCNSSTKKRRGKQNLNPQPTLIGSGSQLGQTNESHLSIPQLVRLPWPTGWGTCSLSFRI
jgi:hypothetical protein